MSNFRYNVKEIFHVHRSERDAARVQLLLRQGQKSVEVMQKVIKADEELFSNLFDKW